MTAELIEFLPELAELLAFGLASLGLAIGGGYIEQFAIATVQTGQPALGGWMALMGVMAFYFAYLLNTDKFLPRLSAVRRNLAEGR